MLHHQRIYIIIVLINLRNRISMKEKTDIDVFARPRDLNKINDLTGNMYEGVVILSKRANQLAKEEKEELVGKLAEFAPKSDNLEEVFDNREQMEISAHYERLPKPSLVSLQELFEDKIYFRNPTTTTPEIEETKE